MQSLFSLSFRFILRRTLAGHGVLSSIMLLVLVLAKFENTFNGFLTSSILFSPPRYSRKAILIPLIPAHATSNGVCQCVPAVQRALSNCLITDHRISLLASSIYTIFSFYGSSYSLGWVCTHLPH